MVIHYTKGKLYMHKRCFQISWYDIIATTYVNCVEQNRKVRHKFLVFFPIYRYILIVATNP